MIWGSPDPTSGGRRPVLSQRGVAMHDVRQSASPLTRRDFLRGVGAGAAALAATSALPNVTTPLLTAAQTTERRTPPTGTAETLLRELWGTLTEEQRRQVVKPWDHRSQNALTRHRMVNAALDRQIGQ